MGRRGPHAELRSRALAGGTPKSRAREKVRVCCIRIPIPMHSRRRSPSLKRASRLALRWRTNLKSRSADCMNRSALRSATGMQVHQSICPDDEDEPPYEEIRYLPTTMPGARLPSVFRDNGTPLFDQLAEDGFTLLALGAGEEETIPMEVAARAAALPLTVLPVDESHIREVYGRRFVLVRPDQHVCWRGDRVPADSARIIDIIRGAASSSGDTHVC